MTKSIRIGTRITPELEKRLEKAVEAQRRTKSQIMLLALERYLTPKHPAHSD